MRVLSIQTERVKRQWRVRVTLDDGTETLLWTETQLRFGISSGAVVSLDKWNELVLFDEQLGCRVKSLRWLAVRPRSADELRQKLRHEKFSDTAIESCLSELAEEGLLDDTDFARRFARSRLTRKPMGRRALEFELRKKGIEEKLRQQVVAELIPDSAEIEMAEKAAKQKIRTYREKDNSVVRRKLSAYLNQRGFSGETIAVVVRRLIDER
jgi:regulatory protein